MFIILNIFTSYFSVLSSNQIFEKFTEFCNWATSPVEFFSFDDTAYYSFNLLDTKVHIDWELNEPL